MNSSEQPRVTPVTQPVDFIRFHGIALLVVRCEGIDYVAAKPIVDMLGLSWRHTRETVQAGDNAVLYGVRRLETPVFGGPQGPTGRPGRAASPPATSQEGTGEADENIGQHGPEKGDLHFMLDRAYLFLARVSTNNMRARGNQEGAAALLALQQEWGAALRAYETHGVAVKKGHHETRQELFNLLKVRGAVSGAEKRSHDRMIADLYAELGYPLNPLAQGELPLEGGAA